MKFKSKQEILDHVVAFFKQQQKPGIYICSRGKVHCVYRNKENYYACAIGCLIPKDEGIRHQDETLAGIWQDSSLSFDAEISREYDFLVALQSAHDNSALGVRSFFTELSQNNSFTEEENRRFMEVFDLNLSRVAKKYDLSYEPKSILKRV